MKAKKPVSKEVALARLQALCSRSEQSTADVLKKMAAWLLPPDARRDILRRLYDDRFVDDRRFARAYARDKMLFSGWGRYKIRLGLVKKRIPRDLADEALASLDPKEYEETALRVLRAKARGIREGNTYEGRTKLFRSAAQRGFETDLLSRLIRTAPIWESEE